MNKKKITTSIIIIVIITILALGTYYILTKQDKNTTLTLLEKQWIEENKNDVIDLGMVNGIPVFNYDGEGLLFEFIKSLETNTGLEFNKISYSLSSTVPSAYAFVYTDTIEKEDILIYQDNYVIFSKEKTKYNNLQDIPKMTLGVLESDLENINFYTRENPNISYKTYANPTDMLEDLKSEDGKIDGAALPKTIYMRELSNNQLHIIYHISEVSKNLVFRLGDSSKLNIIIKKYYNKWSNDNYQEIYNDYFSKNYFMFNNIYEENIANFRSKRYQFGFISYAPYNDLVDNHLVGLNNEIMKQFSKLANIEISFKQYDSMERLLEDFNSNKIDFFMNSTTQTKYEMDVYDTVSIYSENAVILSHMKHQNIVNSLSSLNGKTIITLTDSYISQMLSNKNVNMKIYGNIRSLLNHINKDSIIALDQSTYNIYVHNILKNYKVDYVFTIDHDYNFVIRNITDNSVFAKYFDFYLSFIDEATFANSVPYDLFVERRQNYTRLIIVVTTVIIILIACLIIIAKKNKKPRNKVTSISKESKLKYIDMLTSLKNRNYLNDNIQKWDESEIYPQTIIIVDLNNVAYINDNYGHEEGDNVIRDAANILINNQVENSEIMRTNGNEFLIYMVEYDEKQVIAYIRKLNKEFKDLAHGFGAAIGYSMIQDAIKTVDDAINEATLDMRNNKEEANN